MTHPPTSRRTFAGRSSAWRAARRGCSICIATRSPSSSRSWPAEWKLDKVQLGLLDSAFSTSATLCQFPLGIAADAAGVRLVLTGLIVLWCLGLGMHAWAPSPKYLWYARLTMGIGQSAVYATLSRMAQSWFPPGIRTTLQGLAGITSGRLGGLCANVLFATVLLGILRPRLANGHLCLHDRRTVVRAAVLLSVPQLAARAPVGQLRRSRPDARPDSRQTPRRGCPSARCSPACGRGRCST